MSWSSLAPIPTSNDDGQGFNATVVTKGMGMVNIRARPQEIGGAVDFQSVAADGADTRCPGLP